MLKENPPDISYLVDFRRFSTKPRAVNFMKKVRNIWSVKATIVVSVILIVLFVFLLFDFQYSVSANGNFMKKPTCYDNDPLGNVSKKGFVAIFHSRDIPDTIIEDECADGNLIKYFCDNNEKGYSYTAVKCVCNDGKCVG